MVLAKARVFARVAGWVGLLLGSIGFLTDDLFGLIQFDPTHNIVHLLFGFLGIAAAAQKKWTQYYTYVFGAIYVVLGIGGFFMPEVMGVELEATENLIHLALGTYGVYVALGKETTPPPPKTEE